MSNKKNKGKSPYFFKLLKYLSSLALSGTYSPRERPPSVISPIWTRRRSVIFLSTTSNILRI